MLINFSRKTEYININKNIIEKLNMIYKHYQLYTKSLKKFKFMIKKTSILITQSL